MKSVLIRAIFFIMHQTFNPQDWLQSDSRSDIELVVYRIEASHTDITGSYED